LAVALGVSFFIGEMVMEFLAAPVSEELMRFYQRRVEKAREKLQQGDPQLTEANRPREVVLLVRSQNLKRVGFLVAPGGPELVELPVLLKPVEITMALDEAGRLVGRPPTLAALTATETFVVFLKVCLYCAAVLSSPWVFYQLWAFVAAGLYPHEKRLVHV